MQKFTEKRLANEKKQKKIEMIDGVKQIISTISNTSSSQET